MRPGLRADLLRFRLFRQTPVVRMIDATGSVTDSTLGRYTEVGARAKLVETALGEYSRIVADADVIHATIVLRAKGYRKAHGCGDGSSGRASCAEATSRSAFARGRKR